ncbi:hypothetical protein OSB04_016153 [Centaurea solstitialis]|uniref:Uncharacterized protein n=1 Tax=Centaurea solstitialis TaxID=347529 RepID=A0AA38T852_9ASTR|nr:hypothetical protein OSB04_016153 [Centaurea solstitialis]
MAPPSAMTELSSARKNVRPSPRFGLDFGSITNVKPVEKLASSLELRRTPAPLQVNGKWKLRFTYLFKSKSLLTWETRYKIVHGLASALLYLHE